MYSKWIWTVAGCAVAGGCFAPDFVVDSPTPLGFGGTSAAGAAGLSGRVAGAGASGKVAGSAGASGYMNSAGGTRVTGIAGTGVGAGMGGIAGHAGRGGGTPSAGNPSFGGAGGVGGASATKPDNVAGESGITGSTHNSCVGLKTACQGDSCCRAYRVPGGTFAMGRSTDGTDKCPGGAVCNDNEMPEHSVTIGAYYLEAYEVTVGRFRQFVNAYPVTLPAQNAGANPNVPGGRTGWSTDWSGKLPATSAALSSVLGCPGTTWTPSEGSNEAYPVNCVDWYTAFAFCIWDGGRLPTEAEWEFAAAGGSENRLYPWGNAALDATRAVCRGAATELTVVGSKSAGTGRWRQSDLAGSVFEWTFDYFQSNYYTGLASSNPANTTSSDLRSARGGDWDNSVDYLRSAARYPLGNPSNAVKNIGFRCARDAE